MAVQRLRKASALDPTLPAETAIAKIAEHVKKIGDAILNKVCVSLPIVVSS